MVRRSVKDSDIAEDRWLKRHPTVHFHYTPHERHSGTGAQIGQSYEASFALPYA